MAIVGAAVDPTGIAGAIINPIAQTVLVPVTDHIHYLISCKKYVSLMRTKMRELNTARISVKEHMTRNTGLHLEIPSQVKGWLDEVEGIKTNVENFPSDVISCCSLMIRHKLGRKAFKIIEQMESLTRQHSLISWTDDPVPLGRVGTMNASTSAPSSDYHDGFASREQTFTEALKALGWNHKPHMIALWGMGGVGKTTMMQRLKKVVKEKKMFDTYIEAVVGEKTDPIAIQEAVADYLSIELKEKTKLARAERLRKHFEADSDGGKKNLLVILDDVWQSVNLEDIGLSPFPNQGVDFKVLITSRDKDVCTVMGVEANSILNVELLSEPESQSLFRQFVETSYPELRNIGEDIVSKCCGLPIAIKTMACTLKNKSKDAWMDALSRLEHHDIHNVAPKVFKASYDNLQDEETKSIFLMCGLFPEDFNIPTEELVRYGWGLKLFDKVYTIREARNRLNTCIERLIHTNLLIKSDDGVRVKMHDLVRSFVLDMFSKVEHASIVNHGDMPGWPENDMSGSFCKRVSLTCKGMSEFPRDLYFPNLSILKLTHGDKSLRFPQDFYDRMEKLQVISYYNLKYPLLPTSPQCSTNLRVLHLHECSLKMFDCSSIGNLLNLEVLSFVNSGVDWLPSKIGNLKKLRLLDLTDCDGLRIDKGVFRNLVKLEELYTIVGGQYRKVISFTEDNCNEMAEGLKSLSSLEFQFFQNHTQPKSIRFENLERFKLSVGRSLYGDLIESKHSYENTLKLVIDKDELFESRINELFEKTEVLCLSVGDINDLEDVEVKSSHQPQSSSFYNLRVLVVSKCAELKFLFTVGVANTLSKLDHLEVYKCDNLEELIHTKGGGEDTITFPKLKFLSLRWLPKLSGLCHNVNIIELPQLVELKLDGIPGFTSIYPENKLETSSFFMEEIVIPKLEKMHIEHMKDLKELWPHEFNTSEEVKLREIQVRNCDNLVYIFPCNPMSMLHHLEDLKVEKCGSIEVLFDIDLDSVGEIGEDSSSSSLRSIFVNELGKLREVWRIKGADNSHFLVRGFQAVESICVMECKRFRNVFTPTTVNFDLGALVVISVKKCGENRRHNELATSTQEQEQEHEQIDILSNEETSEVGDCTFHVAFPFYFIRSFHNLRKLDLWSNEGVEVAFEIESPTSTESVTTQDNIHRIFPNLEHLDLRSMNNMSHVWKGNWNKFLILQKEQPDSSFQNLTSILVFECKSIKYLFSLLMAKLLSNLTKVSIEDCEGIEEIVSNRDDEGEEKTTSISPHADTTLFPCLDSLTLVRLKRLKYIGGGGANVRNNELSFNNTTTTATTTASLDQLKLSEVDGVSWNLSQYSREIHIRECHALSSVIPCYAVGQMQKLQVLNIYSCDGMREVFETQGTNNNNNKSGCDEGNVSTEAISRLNNIIMLPNLKILEIINCRRLEHIFTFSTLESLRQLEKLTIETCKATKVIVKEEYDEEKTTTASSKKLVVFPRLKSIELKGLPELVGFFLGTTEFSWPLLDKVIIKDCPQMMVFTLGGSKTPKLKYIDTNLGKHSVDQHGLNFHGTTVANHQNPFTSSYPATSEGIPWSFHNLIELDMNLSTSMEKKIIPSNKLLQLQKLEKIHVSWCSMAEEVFQALKGTYSGFDESQTVFKLLNLREVELYQLSILRYIWKSNQWTTFEFPNLTRLSIGNCKSLEHVFTSSMLGSLLQLQQLHIYDCYRMEEVIVKDAYVVAKEKEEKEEDGGKTNEITLPRLHSLTLDGLPSLKGFCLGKEDFSFPLLDTLKIDRCPSITVFTKGHSATPELKEVETSFGSFYAGEDINTFIKIKQEEFKEHYDYY